MSKESLKEKAIKLRKSGYSYSFIQQKTGVSKSTLSVWLSSVAYKPNQETVDRIGKARSASILAKQKIKNDSLHKAHEQAKIDVGLLSNRDIFMLGIGVYIGEGTKGDCIRIVNSNPKIIVFAIRWFKDVCGLEKKHFRLRLHLYPDSNIEKSLSFWSKTTNIPISQFQKVQIDLREGKGRVNKGKLPYGTAHLSVVSGGSREFGVFLARRISGWIETVLT